ncbi:hypothetical protein CXG81DRAFT_9415 [Caulochytrium protostelioides]|uniref:Eukaryotic translation initiation factor 3 subunit K n=1 Tax=Caulochytrium protostelioides TaxID=1555241 RepID=A0A4P9WXV8_9FUNG|nr:ARM repeat-containing protein [Caulochytrium protostelioides]RKP03576.1 hypothetical protein CXG81DRAFT_9415 [Caulochytrium protostelioides]|eukprot:RKP03576.1 hypothetical protein CXG81DRAFT_9415 [Caulochytrium protostelioides]
MEYDEERLSQADNQEYNQDDQYEEEAQEPVEPLVPCPPNRPMEIHHIVDTVNRYNHNLIPNLVEYVQDQLVNDHFDRDANLALLKLYQFNPDRADAPVVSAILQLALGALPDVDFSLCLALLSKPMLTDRAVQALCACHAALESAHYKSFWQQWNAKSGPKGSDFVTSEMSAADSESVYEALDARIRRFISGSISLTFQSLAAAHVEEYLALSGADLAQWAETMGWTIADVNGEKTVQIPESAHPAPVIVREQLAITNLTKILSMTA